MQALFWPVFTLISFYAYTKAILPGLECRKTLVRLHDPVHPWLPRFDTSIPVNILQYSAYVIYAGTLYSIVSSDPHLTNAVFAAWACMWWIRSLCLWLAPFEVPEGQIHLSDPVQRAYLQDIPAFDKDMLFSGHCSTMILMGISTYAHSPDGYIHLALYAMATVTSVLVLLSRVHYTLDVVVAPFMAYCSMQLGFWLCGH